MLRLIHGLFRRGSLSALMVGVLFHSAVPATLAAEPAKASGPPVVLRWATIENASQSYFPALIRDRGIGAKYGIEVRILPISQTQAQWTTMRSGDADISSGSVLDLMRQRNGGLPAKAVSAFLLYGNQLVTLADKPYAKLTDLKGQKIGTPSATLFDWMILRAAGKKAEGFDVERDGVVQNAAPGLLNGALNKGDLAATLQFSDFTLGPLTSGKYKSITTVPKIMAAAGFDPESFYLTFNLTDAWAKKNPGMVPNVVAAIEEARQVMLSDDSVWPALAKRGGQTDPALLKPYIEMLHGSLRATLAESKLAPTQAMISAIIETVGQTSVGITTVDRDAFDFKSYEAGRAMKR
ncbi:MAG: ABC transporter substrate-binding protein [Betaproteobacteria bacterium]|nr:ABC transporter substrate-binding protein [Betaproteobacteria bacterium]